jgi:hypothetical protein
MHGKIPHTYFGTESMFFATLYHPLQLVLCFVHSGDLLLSFCRVVPHIEHKPPRFHVSTQRKIRHIHT